MAAQDVKRREEEPRAKEPEIVAKLKSTYAAYFHGDIGVEIYRKLIGGVISSFLLELLVYPAIYHVWRGRELRRQMVKSV